MKYVKPILMILHGVVTIFLGTIVALMLTADVGDLVRTIIVDSTVMARIDKKDVIDNANIKSGNVIVGL